MLGLEKLKTDLKGKIGQKVKLVVHTEVRDSELGNMNPHTEPRSSDSEIWIVFLGIYGLGENPLYIHGRDENGKDKLFRNSLDIWGDEDTGNATHEGRTTLRRLDNIDIKSWFERWIFSEDKSEFKKRVKAAEPDEKYLAERILKGEPDYYPVGMSPHYSPCYSIFDEPKFVEKVLAYLEKIV